MNVKTFLRRNLSTALMIAGLFAFRWSVADHYRVPTGSMLPTIQLGDHVFTNKMAYDIRLPFTSKVLANLSEPKRGEVIVFLYPVDPSIRFVKRVIGLPNEIIKIKNRQIEINGQQLEEPYLTEFAQKYQFENEIEVKIPPDHYFVMGDNRENSLDSRYWGFVPRKNILGRANSVLWNISFDDVIPNMKLSRIGQEL